MEEQEHILSGPDFPLEIFDGSVAEFLIPKLKNHPKDTIVQIDAATEESITAPEFLRLSLEVAEGLVKLGLRKGDVVILASPNCIRCHATATGIWFSGGVLAPLDQNLKPFELKHLIQSFQPKFIVCEQVTAKTFQNIANQLQLDAKVIVLNSEGSDSGFLTWDDMRTEVDVENYVPRKVDDPKKDLLLICCSSGSSGLPKGVALSHYSFLYTNTLITSSPLPNGVSVMLTSPLFWVTGVVTLLVSLTVGARRVIPKSGDIRHVVEGIEIYKTAMQFFSPAALSQLLEILTMEKHNLESLKEILYGGSPLGKGVIQKIKGILKHIKFSQNYGMTEFAGPLTMSVDDEITSSSPEAETNDARSSVGMLLPGVKMKVVDITTGKSLGPNKIGECRFKSDRKMICYYNNKEATQSAFDENGWLKTGDLVYYDESGRIYISGRIKEIIKYRNYQISPEEVEIFLMGLPGVVDAAVVPVPHELDSYHLKALVVKLKNSDLTEESIIQSVKENLSDPKHLRAGVQFVESLPKTSNGKIQRAEIHKMFNIK